MRNPLYLLVILAFIACKPQVEKSEDIARTKVSLEEMIGQMIMLGFRGLSIEEVSPQVKDHLIRGRVGGIVLFDYDVIKKEAVRNIASPNQLKKLILGLKELSPTPLLMAVDQEGGRVNRLKSKYGFPKSVSNQYLGQIDNLDSTRHYAALNSSTLTDLGFNVNFAPAVDLNINPENPVIGKIERSYGESHEIVVKHASAWIEEHRKNGILSTLKHFPGHGSSDSDSHYGMTDITNYWSKKELIPFETLLTQDLVALMTAHVVNKELDSVPATLSRNIIHEIVREEWQYNGLIFSDDLHMAAVNALYEFDTILQKSIEAGVDMLVFGNNLKYDEAIPTKVIETVKQLIASGKIDRERIESSYQRIMAVKNQIQ